MARKGKKMVVRDLAVTQYAAEGNSIAHLDGKVIFIEQAIPGDVVDVQLTKNKADWAVGHPVAYKALSPERVAPFCSHFGICGGCQWQMLPYEKQLQYKQQQVHDQLTRIGGLQLPVISPIIGASKTRGYRNKLEFTFTNKRYLSREELGDPAISSRGQFAGFHAKGIFDKVVNIDECHLMEEPVNQIRETIKALAADLPFYDIATHEGWMRQVMYRMCTTGDLMVNVMVGYDHREMLHKVLNGLQEAVPSITSLYYTINTKWNDSMHGLEPVLYAGNEHVIEQLEDFKFKISPKSFFQTNTYQGEKLYQVTRDFAELDGSQVVYDLYCGTGSIGIFLSKGAKKIIGVEAIAEAVADAGENASLNRITHASFFAGDVSNICTDAFFETHGKPDVIITDPPRAGMSGQLVEQILKMEAPLVVYVSCNPATQARDLRMLQDKYEVKKIQPVDMFPHTHHIENVVQLTLKGL